MSAPEVQLLENLAVATWQRLRDSKNFNCSQSEETITDINLLDIYRAGIARIKVWKTDKVQEAQTGIDWEWWIGSSTFGWGWWRYAVQAKKLDKTERYIGLRHKINSEYQIDILERYATANYAIPVYCFYNYVSDITQTVWHCRSPYDPLQLGCTVAPLDIVRHIFQKGNSKTFWDIHRYPNVFPWRCLVKCSIFEPRAYENINPLASPPGKYSVYPPELLPSFLQEGQNTQISHFPDDFYQRDLRIYPKRIMVIDIGRPGTDS